jgi:AcrR family transcriptional regulator
MEAKTEAKNTGSKKSAPKKKDDVRKKILAHYQEYKLMHGKDPASIYAFCKELGINEGEFYKHFNNFQQVSTAFWTDIFTDNLKRLESAKEYEDFMVREKLLSFYYSFFEALKNNRSFALMTLKSQGFTLKQEGHDLGLLKKHFKLWVKELVSEGKMKDEIAGRSRLSSNYDSLFWYQFMFLLDFWRKDGSTNFERTDEAIEKAVNLSFDLIEKNALDSAFDFGKFLFQNIRY